jgi:signal transduction histidine kinase
LRVESSFLEIAVADEGPGIPEGERRRAIEPFERLSTARETDSGGFGLGLAIVRAIAEGHEGSLALTENEPHGLVATIRLPAGRL